MIVNEWLDSLKYSIIEIKKELCLLEKFFDELVVESILIIG